MVARPRSLTSRKPGGIGYLPVRETASPIVRSKGNIGFRRVRQCTLTRYLIAAYHGIEGIGSEPEQSGGGEPRSANRGRALDQKRALQRCSQASEDVLQGTGNAREPSTLGARIFLASASATATGDARVGCRG